MADTEEGCIFCRIASGELGTVFLAETPDVVAFRDLSPQAPFHALVVPKRHIASLDEAGDPELLGKLMEMVAGVAREGRLTSGYRTVINTGKDGGQTVDHLHAHILGGRHMAWPPG